MDISLFVNKNKKTKVKCKLDAELNSITLLNVDIVYSFYLIQLKSIPPSFCKLVIFSFHNTKTQGADTPMLLSQVCEGLCFIVFNNIYKKNGLELFKILKYKMHC